MSRINLKFWELKAQKKKALIPFIVAGTPSLNITKKLILALEKVGADIIELGVPFSDPMADGPVIQRASEKSLAAGTSLKKILGLIRDVRRETEIPILLMGYYNPILSYGLRRYAVDAARAGVDATLVVDLPPEESLELDRELKRVGIDLIYLLAPTSGRERIRLVAKRGRGFIYFVSMTGVTGSRLKNRPEIKGHVALIRRHTGLPIAVGFGVKSPSDARQVARLADGVVIGSELVRRISSSSHPLRAAGSFLSAIGKI
ncbi:MAG: tryptophan synthase subunit alpha [Deltaproteobacteria bacterium]|nr:tryptophan synthase subunit alpha [Deltaproteobacteria bacterium]